MVPLLNASAAAQPVGVCDPTAEVEVKNRFSGQSTTMPEFAAAVYDAIIGSEMFGDYDTVRKGLDWFKQHFAKQYMVVLD